MRLLIKFLYSILPTIALPSTFNDLVTGFTEYAYWANYYLPITDIILLIFLLFSLEVSFHLFKFLYSVLGNFDLTGIFDFFASKFIK